MRTVGMLIQETRLAARTLRRSRGFTIAAVATLALGIGANSAIFSLINKTLLEPLPYPHAERIVQMWLTNPQGGGVTLSIPEVNLLARQSAVLEDVAAYDFGGPGVNLAGGGEPEQVKAIHVSEAYFRLFGARVALGRTFTEKEDRPGGGRVVVLSHGLWMRRYGSDPSVVGKTISLGNEAYEVIGVVGAEYHPDPPAQLWLPLQADPNGMGQAHFMRAAGRLRSGVSLDQANAQLKRATAEFLRLFPLFNQKAVFQAKQLRETNVGDLRTALLVLLVTVTLVLLIACSNVANLLLVRASARQREICIRAALGASPGQLAAQLVIESVLLSIVGGAAGLGLGRICLDALLSLQPGMLGGVETGVPLDWRVLSFTMAVSLGAALMFGLVPALRASRPQLAAAIHAGSLQSGTSRPAARMKAVLVVAQVALAVVLVTGAGLMIRTFAALRQVEPGIETHHIVTMEMSLLGSRAQDTAGVTRLVADGAERLRRMPGVMAAGTSWTLPVELAFGSSVFIEGRPLADGVVHGGALMRPVSAGYFSVFRVPLLRGRYLREQDSGRSAGVVVISEAMARKYWPKQDPIGQRITLDKYTGADFAAPPREIVGVVGDVRDLGIGKAPEPLVYLPQGQVPNGMTRIDMGILPITWVVRTTADPYSLSAAIQRALREASGGLAVARIRSMEEIVRRSTARSDFVGLLLTTFAAAALLLAAVGIYGLISYSIGKRMRELGIRLALGATPGELRRMVLGEGMRMAGVGVIIGAMASLGLARFMATLVYGVEPADAGVLVGACVTLGLVAVVAGYVPAYRAGKLDPAVVLRSE